MACSNFSNRASADAARQLGEWSNKERVRYDTQRRTRTYSSTQARDQEASVDKYEFLLAFTGIITSGVVILTVFGTIGKVLGKRRDDHAIGGGGMANLDERLARMEQAIDAMAVEMERVAEGQRFTSRLLADGGRERRPVEPG